MRANKVINYCSLGGEMFTDFPKMHQNCTMAQTCSNQSHCNKQAPVLLAFVKSTVIIVRGYYVGNHDLTSWTKNQHNRHKKWFKADEFGKSY
jgi:hypothetical protein